MILLISNSFFLEGNSSLARTRNAIPSRRSPDSVASFAVQSNTPLPPIANSTKRTSVLVSTSGYISPEYQKPPTPYEDKVIPTLRNRNRADAGQSLAVTSVGNNDEAESVVASVKDDDTAELNQAEMIEANQMMIVFDRQLVKNKSSNVPFQDTSPFSVLDK